VTSCACWLSLHPIQDVFHVNTRINIPIHGTDDSLSHVRVRVLCDDALSEFYHFYVGSLLPNHVWRAQIETVLSTADSICTNVRLQIPSSSFFFHPDDGNAIDCIGNLMSKDTSKSSGSISRLWVCDPSS